jgi:DNA-binding transcriptional LysR family regulator
VPELEAQVGSDLLLRNPRSVELTPAGQSLLFYARQLKQTLTQLDHEPVDYATGLTIKWTSMGAVMLACLQSD